MARAFIFPLEILSIIKDYLFDYRKTFTKKVLPFVKQNYPIKLYCLGPKTNAIEVMDSGNCMFINREFSNNFQINSFGVRDDEESLLHPEVVVLGDSEVENLTRLTKLFDSLAVDEHR